MVIYHRLIGLIIKLILAHSRSSSIWALYHRVGVPIYPKYKRRSFEYAFRFRNTGRLIKILSVSSPEPFERNSCIGDTFLIIIKSYENINKSKIKWRDRSFALYAVSSKWENWVIIIWFVTRNIREGEEEGPFRVGQCECNAFFFRDRLAWIGVMRRSHANPRQACFRTVLAFFIRV